MAVKNSMGNALGTNIFQTIVHDTSQAGSKKLNPIKYINGQLDDNFEVEIIFRGMCNKED